MIESVANTLRGMSLDPRIPQDARTILMEQVEKLGSELGYVNVYEDEDGENVLGATDLDEDLNDPLSGIASDYTKYLGRGEVRLIKPAA